MFEHRFYFVILIVVYCLLPTITHSLDEECQQILNQLQERCIALNKVLFTQVNEAFVVMPMFINPEEAKKYAVQQLNSRFRSQMNSEEYQKAMQDTTTRLLKGSFGMGANHRYTIYDSSNYIRFSIDKNKHHVQCSLLHTEYFVTYDIERNSVEIIENNSKSRATSSIFFQYENFYTMLNDPAVTITCEHSNGELVNVTLQKQDEKMILIVDLKHPSLPKHFIHISNSSTLEIEYSNPIIVNGVEIPTHIIEHQSDIHPVYNEKYLAFLNVVEIQDFKFMPEMTQININFEMPEGTMITDTRTSKQQQAMPNDPDSSGFVRFKEWMKNAQLNLTVNKIKVNQSERSPPKTIEDIEIQSNTDRNPIVPQNQPEQNRYSIGYTAWVISSCVLVCIFAATLIYLKRRVKS